MSMLSRSEVEKAREKAYNKSDSAPYGPDKDFWRTIAESFDYVLGTEVDWHEELKQ